MLPSRIARLVGCAAVGSALGVAPPVQAAPTKAECGKAYEKGQELRAKKRLVESLRQLRVCAQAQCPGFIQKDCSSWSAELSQSIPSFVIVATGSDGSDISEFTAELDGEPVSGPDGVIEVNPGDHKLLVKREGLPSVTKLLSFKEGDQRKVVKITFKVPDQTAAEPAAAASSPPPDVAADQRDLTWPIVSLGIGAVGIGVGGFFLLRSASNRSDADALYSECQRDNGCLKTDPRSSQISQFDDDARRAQTLGIVGLAIGGVAIAAGVTLFVLEGSDGKSSVQAYLAPTGGGLSGQF